MSRRLPTFLFACHIRASRSEWDRTSPSTLVQVSILMVVLHFTGGRSEMEAEASVYSQTTSIVIQEKCNTTIRIDTWTSVEGDVLSHSDRLARMWHANKKVGNRRLIRIVRNVHY